MESNNSDLENTNDSDENIIQDYESTIDPQVNGQQSEDAEESESDQEEVYLEELRSELEQELDATARTVVAGFSPAKPFQSYRKNKERLKRIAALPQKIKKDKK